ncbi:hypothetical protein LSTR_LSTR011114 [Laodelphax striatellus]|uniref:Vesicle-fusing ATPase n=1 Tax=Laodelphax striatellus TaxID=195883 RepID=A0A482XNB3_LAOST|nr:hypothetical protein LSTR_LSTR011114 [Laodelphax striatellus]
MEVKRMRVGRCPTDEKLLLNSASLNKSDFSSDLQYIEVSTQESDHPFVFTVNFDDKVPVETVCFSLLQRKWATLSINQEIRVRPYRFNVTKSSECVSSAVFTIDFMQKKSATTDMYNSDDMVKEFLTQNTGLALTVGQMLSLRVGNKLFLLVVKSLEGRYSKNMCPLFIYM